MTTLFDALGSLAIGAIGWIATAFAGRPVRNFFDLRYEAKRQTLLVWHVPEIHSIEPPDRQEFYQGLAEQRSALHELGAKFVAFDRSEGLAVWFVRLLGYDPENAGNTLIVIARELGTTHEDRDKNFRLLDTALKFRFDKKRTFYNPYVPGR